MKGIVETAIIRKAGGRFHLTSLLQKRLRDYMLAGQLGARKEDGQSILELVLGEVRKGDVILEEDSDVEDTSVETASQPEAGEESATEESA